MMLSSDFMERGLCDELYELELRSCTIFVTSEYVGLLSARPSINHLPSVGLDYFLCCSLRAFKVMGIMVM